MFSAFHLVFSFIWLFSHENSFEVYTKHVSVRSTSPQRMEDNGKTRRTEIIAKNNFQRNASIWLGVFRMVCIDRRLSMLTLSAIASKSVAVSAVDYCSILHSTHSFESVFNLQYPKVERRLISTKIYRFPVVVVVVVFCGLVCVQCLSNARRCTRNTHFCTHVRVPLPIFSMLLLMPSFRLRLLCTLVSVARRVHSIFSVVWCICFGYSPYLSLLHSAPYQIGIMCKSINICVFRIHEIVSYFV